MTIYQKLLDEANLEKYKVEYVHPEKVVTYIAYKDGKSETFDNLREAKAFSSLYETKETITNLAEVEFYEKANDLYYDKLDEVNTKWHEEIRKDYDYLNDEQYGFVYSQAYDDGHSYGYGEVEIYLDRYAIMVRNCLDAANKK